jgi:DNA (cytosine-5)-methyltransferase 1
LDLFCGAGGAAKGLQRAGYHVTGVDIKDQPNYCGDVFKQEDAMEWPVGSGWDLIWASPPCQAYSVVTPDPDRHPDLIGHLRARLEDVRGPWVIENVRGAPLRSPIMLCGVMFGLKVFRHRYFETSPWMLAPEHPRHDGATGTHRWPYKPVGDYVQVTGSGGNFTVPQAKAAMGIGWDMTHAALAEAIPPAYSEWIGRQILERTPAQDQQEPTDAGTS